MGNPLLITVITLLGIFTCRTGSHALLRHWPYFQRQQAEETYIILTTNTECLMPEGVPAVAVGVDSYIYGPHLPQRLVDALREFLNVQWDVIILAEYDTLIFHRIKVEEMKTQVASHPAGNIKIYPFYHNPWVFTRDAAEKFVAEGDAVIAEGLCSYGSSDSSPDCFFGLVCYRLDMPVQNDLWMEFTRNSYDNKADLALAKEAYDLGIDVIHGVKTAVELSYILGTQ